MHKGVVVIKYITLTILSLLLTGCGKFSRIYTHYTGEFTYKCSKSGTEYVQSDSGLAIHIDSKGKPIKCR